MDAVRIKNMGKEGERGRGREGGEGGREREGFNIVKVKATISHIFAVKTISCLSHQGYPLNSRYAGYKR